MKLKTLKNLEHSKVMIEEYVKHGKVIKQELFISTNILKQEAIKWVKAILELDEEILEEALSRNTRVSWIINFFNITKEDLK